jgi:hypothetical protein
MRTSLGGQDKPPLDRSKAWSLLVTNVLVLPGLGSVMAGHRTGYLQITLALAGFFLTLGALIKIVMVWGQEFQLPEDPQLYRSAIIGMAAFLLAWVWSLLLSMRFFQVKK